MITTCGATILNSLDISNLYGEIIKKTLVNFRDTNGDGTSMLLICLSELFQNISSVLFRFNTSTEKMYLFLCEYY